MCAACEKETAVLEHYSCSECGARFASPAKFYRADDVDKIVESLRRYIKSVDDFEDGAAEDAYNELEDAWYKLRDLVSQLEQPGNTGEEE
jgi:hypothetical protein